MPAYELAFEVSGFDEKQLDQIEMAFDVVASEGHGRSEMTVLVPGDTLDSALQHARHGFDDAGLRIVRMIPGYVTRAEIARRANVTTQAVGQYARGERGTSFPAPALSVPAHVWVWGDVLPWLLQQGCGTGDGVTHPTRDEYEMLQFRLWDQQRASVG